MADCVDAAMQEMKPTEPEPAIDRIASQPEHRQLAPGYHPVLPLREFRDPLVGTTSLLQPPHRRGKSRLVKIRPLKEGDGWS